MILRAGIENEIRDLRHNHKSNRPKTPCIVFVALVRTRAYAKHVFWVGDTKPIW
jgi:hypothetical protein